MADRQDTPLATESGIPLAPVYRPGTPDESYRTRLGDPGEYPFTRGVRPPGAGRHAWIQRELSGEGDARRTNAQLRRLLAHGQTGLDVIGDAPTQAMVDPDHPYARHAVGTQGVSLCRHQDWLELYDDIPLDRLTLSHSLPPLMCVPNLVAVARARGIDPATIRGSVVQAPYFAEDNGYAVHMPFALRERMAVDTIAFTTEHMPRFHTFLEDTYFVSDGVLDAVEEMALGFVEIRGLVRQLLARGLDIDAFAPRIAILVNCSMDLFETVAKIRATRRLFARMLREEFGATDPRSWAVTIAAHTSGFSLTGQQPVNNVVRGTVQALALVLAGVQAMEVSAFDEAYRTPSPEAHLVGLRTQQIVALESGVGRVADPLGGAWYVEALTDDLEQRIAAMVRDIEAQGTPAELSDRGWFRAVFARGMERYGRALTDGSLPKVGVNCFTVPEAEDVLLREVSETTIAPDRERIDAIRRWRATRDASRVVDALAALRAVADDRAANLTPATAAAYEAGASQGEIAGVLRESYGWPADPLGQRATGAGAVP